MKTRHAECIRSDRWLYPIHRWPLINFVLNFTGDDSPVTIHMMVPVAKITIMSRDGHELSCNYFPENLIKAIPGVRILQTVAASDWSCNQCNQCSISESKFL